MEKVIKEASDQILQGSEIQQEITPLMACSIAVAKEAMIGRSGKLRDIALEIAKGIADYDWEMRNPSGG